MKIAIVGPSRCGKDTAAEWLVKRTTLRYAGSLSSFILPHAARRLGLCEPEAWATRHDYRNLWREIGDELRRDDPAALARMALQAGDIVCGVRSASEMRAIGRYKLVDIVLWIDRPGVPDDPTLEFGPGAADIIVQNMPELAQFRRRLDRLAMSWGIKR